VTRNQTLLISLVVAAAAVFGYWHFLLSPKRADAAQLSTDIAAKEASVQQATATAAEYAKQRGAYNTNYATLVRLGKAAPGDDDVRSLLVQIAGTARRTGVDFRKIEVGGDSGTQPTVTGTTTTAAPPGATPIGTGGVFAMPFTFTFTGRFNNLGGFLSQLERYVTLQEKKVAVTGRLLRVESIDLKPGGSGYPMLEADVDATSYLATPAKVAAPAAAGASAATTPASSSGGTSTPTTTATATGAIR
jgi:Tfp pilus assembly protein PilO